MKQTINRVINKKAKTPLQELLLFYVEFAVIKRAALFIFKL